MQNSKTDLLKITIIQLAIMCTSYGRNVKGIRALSVMPFVKQHLSGERQHCWRVVEKNIEMSIVTKMLYASRLVSQHTNMSKLPVARAQASKPAAEALKFAAPRHRSASAAHSPDSLSCTLPRCLVVRSLEDQVPQIPA